MNNYDQTPLKSVLTFWFEELGKKDWFRGGPALDERISRLFLDTHGRVAAGEYWQQRTTGHAYLAEVIVLDQFSRQIYRNQKAAFAFDDLALSLAQHAIDLEFDIALSQTERSFLYMPFMHSESQKTHTEAVKLFTDLGNENKLKYELDHKKIIDQFGRYPHRNKVLGRASTSEELAYLADPKSRVF